MSKKKTTPRPAAAQPASAAALLAQAQQHMARQQLPQAQQACQQALQLQPGHAGGWQMLGILHLMQQQPAQATPALQQALALAPRDTRTLCLLAVACTQQGQADQALAWFDQALAIDPAQASTWYDRGNALFALHRLDEALQSHDRALALNPALADGWLNRGLVLRALHQPAAALASFERALDLDPRRPGTWLQLAPTLHQLGRLPDALACYEKALALAPDNASALLDMGDLLAAAGRADLALQRYEQATRQAPGNASAWHALGKALSQQPGRYHDALHALEQAHALDAQDPDTAALLMYLRLRMAQWDGLPPLLDAALRPAPEGQPRHNAFATLCHPGITAPAMLQVMRQCADTVRRAQPPLALPPRNPAVAQPPQRRLRLAYLSGDLHEHPVAYLMAGVFEAHDKTRFETYAISTHPADKQTPMRQRLRQAFDHFIDIRQLGDAQAATLIARHGIDILIDLSGHTSYNRMGVVQYRPAPVQAAYLGLPATSGMQGVDYILGDRWVTPPGSAAEFSEHIVRLPDSFQANDSQRPRPASPASAAARAAARTRLGLPADGFVFCSFNNTYKVNPATFAIWMRLLAQTPGSVLWLVADEPGAEANFRQHAQAQGVSPGRLVFAPRCPYEEYLARYPLADLFLDTLPFNAGTTASDALWMGLPLLTCTGHTFAGRMASSLLANAGLPQLITATAADYEALALQLAHHPALLQAHRQRLQAAPASAPLFNTQRFTRHLERALHLMWARHAQGLPPAEIDVPPLEQPLPA